MRIRFANPAWAVPAAALMLGACTSTIALPPVSVAATDKEPIAGRYRVVVQTGGWHIKPDRKGWTCSAYGYEMDVDAVYVPAMREALAQVVAKPDFADTIVPPGDLRAEGYDGQIVIQQTNAAVVFAVESRLFFGADTNVDVGLTTISAVIGEAGLQDQRTSEGRAKNKSGTFLCSESEEIIQEATNRAIGDLVVKTAAAVRESLTMARKTADGAAPQPSVATSSSTGRM